MKMQVKVFEVNQKGKIEFTRAELEKLLNEVYMDGYREGEANAYSKTYTWTTPYCNYTDCTSAATVTALDTGNASPSLSITSGADSALTETVTTAANVVGSNSVGSNSVGSKTEHANGALAAMPTNTTKVTATANAKPSYCVEDFIAKLAKELNF